MTRLPKLLLTVTSAGALCAAGPKPKAPAADDAVKIALVFDFEGRWAEPKNILLGLELLTVDRAKLNKRPVRFIKYDSGDNAAGTLNAMKAAIDARPDAIIAEVHSSKALVAAELAEKAGIPMVTTLATSPAVTAGKAYVFRATFSDDFQGAQLGKYAVDVLKARTAAVVADATQVYSTGLAALFKNSFVAKGGRVVVDERVLPGAPSFAATLAKIVAEKPDVIFLPLYEQTGARFISEASAAGLQHVRYLGGDGLAANNALLDLVVKSKIAVDAHWVSHFSGTFTPQYARFKDLKLDGAAAVGYDCGLILMTALDALGWPKGPISGAALADKIRSGKPIHGLSGDLRFDGAQDPKKPIYLRTIKNGEMVYAGEYAP